MKYLVMRALICIVLILLPVSSYASETHPDVITAFFGPDGIENKKDWYSGEMLEYYLDKPTLGETLPEDIQISVRSLESGKLRAIYAVALEKDGQVMDYYAFLVRDDSRWKLEAVRSLALTGIFYMALQELENKDERDEEEEWQYQNMLLTIKSDAELKEYITSNLDALNKIADLVQKGLMEEANSLAHTKHLHSVEPDSDEDNIIKIIIGGILDNTVGIMYVPDDATPPQMKSIVYIYIEKVTGNWFLYKTT